MPYIEAVRAAGCSSLSELARALIARLIETPAGGRDCAPGQVSRILKRVEYVALYCMAPRLEAALALEPNSQPCPCGCGLMFATGW